MAEWFGRRFYDDPVRKVNGSTPSLVSLLRHWIRCFTMIISASWNLAGSKLKSEENSTEKFVLRIAPPLLSYNRRIKNRKINQKSTLTARSANNVSCLSMPSLYSK